MTGGDPSGSSRLIRPTAYQAAVVLSGIAAVLGLVRELLVLNRLGLGERNDALQFALSIVYTVALFGEPLRLGSLNLLGRRISSPLALTICSLVAAVAVVTTVAYAETGPDLPPAWVLVAGGGGAANLLLAWMLPRRLKAGPFLAVHAVSVLPNLLIVGGLLLPAPSDVAFAERVLFLFLAAPVVQLGLLVLLGLGRVEEEGGPAGVAEAFRPIAWHAAGAGGSMASQFLIRAAIMARGPAGALTAFVVALRVADTIRAVLVDTYIGSRIRRWSEGRHETSALVDGRWLQPGAILGVAAAGLAVALAWPWAPGTYADPSGVVLALGVYLVLALRVRYQERNVAALPLETLRHIAILELGTAAAVGLLAGISLVPLAVLTWLAYVARPAIGLQLVSPRSADVRLLEPEG